MAHYYAPPETASLQAEVSQLTEQVQELQQAQWMPTLVLNRYRDSVCYVFGVYQVGFPGHTPALRAYLRHGIRSIRSIAGDQPARGAALVRRY